MEREMFVAFRNENGQITAPKQCQAWKNTSIDSQDAEEPCYGGGGQAMAIGRSAIVISASR